MSIKKPVKKHVYTRDDFRCRKCGAKEPLQLHHVMPQRLGGPDDSFNLVTLCHECHKGWHAIESEMGIGCMEERVIKAFYIWLKEERNPNKFLQDMKLYNDIKRAQGTKRKKSKTK